MPDCYYHYQSKLKMPHLKKMQNAFIGYCEKNQAPPFLIKKFKDYNVSFIVNIIKNHVELFFKKLELHHNLLDSNISKNNCYILLRSFHLNVVVRKKIKF